MTHDQKAPSYALFPVFVLSCVFTLYLCMQTAFLISDRTSLQQAQAQQDKPLAQLEKVKAQINALGAGTLDLAKHGNKDAQEIIQQLKKSGVEVNPNPQAPAPAEAK